MQIRDLEDKLSALEEEKLNLSKSYEKQLEEKTVMVEQLNSRLEEMKTKYEEYNDQLKNLQVIIVFYHAV